MSLAGLRQGRKTCFEQARITARRRLGVRLLLSARGLPFPPSTHARSLAAAHLAPNRPTRVSPSCTRTAHGSPALTPQTPGDTRASKHGRSPGPSQNKVPSPTRPHPVDELPTQPHKLPSLLPWLLCSGLPLSSASPQEPPAHQGLLPPACTQPRGPPSRTSEGDEEAIQAPSDSPRRPKKGPFTPYQGVPPGHS